MSNLEMLRKLSVGIDDTETVTIDYEGETGEFTLRPLTAGELSKIQAIEKKSLVVKVGMKNGQRQSVQSNINDVNVNTGKFTEDQSNAIFKAIALSLSVGDEKISIEDVKQMKPGLPELLFEQVIRISNLSDEDLTSIKSFRQDG